MRIATLDKEGSRILDSDAYRRLVGLLFGTAAGLVYSLASQLVNLIALPGIPYSALPFGTLGNIVASVAWGAALGLLNAWPAGAILGITLSSAASALAFVFRSLVLVSKSSSNTSAIAVTAVLIILPIFLVNVPAMAVLRWAIGKQENAQGDSPNTLERLRLPLVMLLVVAVAGSFSLLRPEARAMIAHMDTLVRSGIEAGSGPNLPAALRIPESAGFLMDAQDGYVLQWDNNNIGRFAIPRPGTNFSEQAVVIARSEDGWGLVCLFVPADPAPTCRAYQPEALREAMNARSPVVDVVIPKSEQE